MTDVQTMGFAFLSGCGLVVAAWGTLLRPAESADVYRDARAKLKWPLIGAVCVFAYVAWERQGVINDTCESLRNAMDFDASGPRSARSIPFDKTVELFSISPSLQEATRICKAAYRG